MFFKKTRVKYLRRYRDEVVQSLRECGVGMVPDCSTWFSSAGSFKYANIFVQLIEDEPFVRCWVEVKTDQYNDDRKGVIPDIPLCRRNRDGYPGLCTRFIPGVWDVATRYPLVTALDVAREILDMANKVEVANRKVRQPEFLRRCQELRKVRIRARDTMQVFVEQIAREVAALTKEVQSS